MNLHKRNCCSTWVPRKIWSSRKIREIFFIFAKNGRLQIKEFGSTATEKKHETFCCVFFSGCSRLHYIYIDIDICPFFAGQIIKIYYFFVGLEI